MNKKLLAEFFIGAPNDLMTLKTDVVNGGLVATYGFPNPARDAAPIETAFLPQSVHIWQDIRTNGRASHQGWLYEFGQPIPDSAFDIHNALLTKELELHRQLIIDVHRAMGNLVIDIVDVVQTPHGFIGILEKPNEHAACLIDCISPRQTGLAHWIIKEQQRVSVGPRSPSSPITLQDLWDCLPECLPKRMYELATQACSHYPNGAMHTPSFRQGISVLGWNIFADEWSSVERLLELSPQIDRIDFGLGVPSTAFSFACGIGAPREVIKKFLAKNASIEGHSTWDLSPIGRTIIRNDIETLENLIHETSIKSFLEDWGPRSLEECSARGLVAAEGILRSQLAKVTAMSIFDELNLPGFGVAG